MTPVGRAVNWRRTQCESCLAIDMKNLAKWADMEQNSRRTLTWSYGSRVTDSVGVEVFAGREILIHYTLTDRWTKEKKSIENWVMIESTKCFYVGKRWWFLSPKCERRCRRRRMQPLGPIVRSQCDPGRTGRAPMIHGPAARSGVTLHER